MAVFFHIFVGILVALLAWRGQALQIIVIKGYSITEDGERAEPAGEEPLNKTA